MKRISLPVILLLNVLFFGGGLLYVFWSGGGFDPRPPVEMSAMRPGNFTLAVSWQPAFCETASNKPECRTQTSDRFDARHFALHGLWPEPAGNIYCGVDSDIRQRDSNGAWSQLPEVVLSPPLRGALDSGMPGTQSLLDRHEWIKHGTCTGASQELYYLNSLSLMVAVNGSAAGQLFAGNIGKTLDATTVRTAFDTAFGSGAGARVSLDCANDNNRRIITGLKISLSGQLGDLPDIGALTRAAPTRSAGCPGGVVDAVGLQ